MRRAVKALSIIAILGVASMYLKVAGVAQPSEDLDRYNIAELTPEKLLHEVDPYALCVQLWVEKHRKLKINAIETCSIMAEVTEEAAHRAVIEKYYSEDAFRMVLMSVVLNGELEEIDGLIDGYVALIQRELRDDRNKFLFYHLMRDTIAEVAAERAAELQ